MTAVMSKRTVLWRKGEIFLSFSKTVTEFVALKCVGQVKVCLFLSVACFLQKAACFILFFFFPKYCINPTKLADKAPCQSSAPFEQSSRSIFTHGTSSVVQSRGRLKKSGSCDDLNVPTLDLLHHSEGRCLTENVLVPISFKEKNPWGIPQGHGITV